MIAMIFFVVSAAVYFVCSALNPPPRTAEVSIIHDFDARHYSNKGKWWERFFDTIGYINLPLVKNTGIGAHYGQLLDCSGMNLSVHGFLAVKELCAVFFFMAAFLANIPSNFLILAALIGAFFPDGIIHIKINSYRESIIRVLPECVDLLSLCISAGLDFMGAIRWITESKVRFETPFTRELIRLRDEISLGKSKTQALQDMEARLDIPEISSLVRTLLLAEKLGMPISEALDNFSTDTRERRFHKGERVARMAAIKVLFPLIFFILPTIGIIILGPVLMQFMQQGLVNF